MNYSRCFFSVGTAIYEFELKTFLASYNLAFKISFKKTNLGLSKLHNYMKNIIFRTRLNQLRTFPDC